MEVFSLEEASTNDGFSIEWLEGALSAVKQNTVDLLKQKGIYRMGYVQYSQPK